MNRFDDFYGAITCVVVVVHAEFNTERMGDVYSVVLFQGDSRYTRVGRVVRFFL